MNHVALLISPKMAASLEPSVGQRRLPNTENHWMHHVDRQLDDVNAPDRVLARNALNLKLNVKTLGHCNIT